ncbi:MAG: glycosyltransferase [Fibrobacter sp.]|nr:glycosyltransferase [Fibrobacter sp.]
MFTVVDFNNFWSPSGGGVRRYHLQKMAFYEQQSEVLSVFVMPDSSTYTEKKSDGLIIEHVEAFRFPGNWEYRFIWKQSQIRPILSKYKPDVIEVGSPYILPSMVRRAAKKICPGAALLSFWHADFPITYVERPVSNKLGAAVGSFCKKIAFGYARQEFKKYDGVQVSCKEVLERCDAYGLPKSHWIPLGCDIQMFSPQKRDEELVTRLKEGDPHRLTIFFPHRFCEEKGIELLLDAYDILANKLNSEPALILAGTGPYLHQVQEAAQSHPHIQYAGFIKSIDEMARYYASVDLGLALSGWETFGLSILESMACGNAQIGANSGAAAEHVKESNAGTILQTRTPQALADAIIELYHSDLTQKKTNARKYAEKFSWSDCFKRQLTLYKEISKQKGNSHD